MKPVTYKVKVKEFNKAPKLLEITTKDIKWSMDQYARNRHVEKWEVIEEGGSPADNLLLG